MRKLCSIADIFICLLILSCATTVPVTVTRPARLDLQGAKTIAVLPFQTSRAKTFDSTGSVYIDVINLLVYAGSGDDPNQIDAVQQLTETLTEDLSHSEYLTLIDADTVKQALEAKEKAPVDVYLTGQITHFDYSTMADDRTELVNGKSRPVRYFYKKVTATISYKIIDSETNRVIGYRTADIGRTAGPERDILMLPSPYNIIRNDLDSVAVQILKDIQPYHTTLSLKMLKSKNKSVGIKAADNLVKKGMIAEAETAYYSIYQSDKDFAAGYNAAKLMQAEGKLEDAKKLMNELVTTTGSKQAVSGLQSIQYEIDQAEKLKQQQAQKQ